ncbi:MAG TPA: AgmX/PglI C-terminal domain-containing protein [Polyangiaceae bacterium]|nr:AgmX/PglI C-terminal domain-containing protein [Polyangiaceae bacterium]
MAHVHSPAALGYLPARFQPRSREQAPHALEVVTSWGTSVLSVRHSYPPREFAIGNGSAPADFVAPEELGVAARHTLCAVEAGAVTITDERGERRPLLCDRPCTVRFGALSFHCRLIPHDPARFPKGDWDSSALAYFAASLGSVLSLVIALASFAPPLGVTDEAELDRERLQTMLQILETRAERERLVEEAAGATNAAPSQPADEVPAPAGARGRHGLIAPRRAASSAPHAARDAAQSRLELLREAQDFGLIPLLRAQPEPGPLWQRDGALNPASQTLLGDLFSPALGEMAGSGGLVPSGPGSGSGGPGSAIALDGVGGCNTLESCFPASADFTRERMTERREHRVSAPRVRPNGGPDVSGVLPAELVQRVVRQNFGRFRNCYEDGLRRNPSLSGRVTARFVIDRSGAVTLAQNGGSDLPDSSVVSCVVSAFYGLSFPAPDNGIVRVSYPIAFSVG